MALLESLAVGVPVIAADVGWVSDILGKSMGPTLFGGEVCTRFEPGRVDQLVDILDYLVRGRRALRDRVLGLSYASYADNLLTFFEDIGRGER